MRRLANRRHLDKFITWPQTSLELFNTPKQGSKAYWKWDKTFLSSLRILTPEQKNGAQSSNNIFLIWDKVYHIVFSSNKTRKLMSEIINTYIDLCNFFITFACSDSWLIFGLFYRHLTSFHFYFNHVWNTQLLHLALPPWIRARNYRTEKNLLNFL